MTNERHFLRMMIFPSAVSALFHPPFLFEYADNAIIHLYCDQAAFHLLAVAPPTIILLQAGHARIAVFDHHAVRCVSSSSITIPIPIPGMNTDILLLMSFCFDRISTHSPSVHLSFR